MNNNSTYSAAIYCRLSKDDEQVGESVSIETQKMMLTDFCYERGYPIYNIYVDDGFSGLNFNRPAFMRLIDDIESGKVNLVITKDLSRLGRDYIQTGYYIDVYFNKKRVRYIAVNDGIDTEFDNNDIAPFKNILNDMYAKDLSRKIKTAKRQRSYKGYYTANQPPYGYKVDPQNSNHLVVDKEAADVVKEIFNLALQRYNYCEISRILTQRKILSPAAYKLQNGDSRFLQGLSNKLFYEWNYTTISTILHNQVYTGDMVNNKTEVVNYKTKERVSVPKEKYIIVANMHEPIICREEFEAVQEILEKRKKATRHNSENIFKGKVFCADCGKEMILVNSKVRTKYSLKFQCHNYLNSRKKCSYYKSMKYDELCEIVLKSIQNLVDEMKKGELGEYINEYLIQRFIIEHKKVESQKIQEQLLDIKKKIKGLYKDFAADIISIDEYNSLFAEYTNKNKELIKKLYSIEENEENNIIYRENIKLIKPLLNQCFNIEKLTSEIINLLIERIEIGHIVEENGCKQKNINIVYRFKKPKSMSNQS